MTERYATKEEIEQHHLPVASNACFYCKFFDATDAKINIHEDESVWAELKGFCKRYPPTVTNDDGDLDMLNPMVMHDDWCGEFQNDPARDASYYCFDEQEYEE